MESKLILKEISELIVAVKELSVKRGYTKLEYRPSYTEIDGRNIPSEFKLYSAKLSSSKDNFIKHKNVTDCKNYVFRLIHDDSFFTSNVDDLKERLRWKIEEVDDLKDKIEKLLSPKID